MTLHPNLIFLAGLVIIILGAELLLRGAQRMAALLGVKPIIIGLTVVSIGTSAPELAIGIAAALEGRGPLAVGNIAGTNMLNILFILGLSAALRPLPIHLMSLRFDVPVIIVTALALIAMAWDGSISQVEGALLLVGAVLYTLALIRLSRQESSARKKEFAEEFSAEAVLPPVDPDIPKPEAWAASMSLVFFLAGLGLTVFGADLMVSGASSIARLYGISDAVIGLTIVAIGTSAPELATTLLATWKDDRDVAIGNLIGSSTYNVLAILGMTCLASPGGVDVSGDILWIDLPLAAGVAILCYPVFRSDRLVSRREGILFVTLYLLYLSAIIFLRG